MSEIVAKRDYVWMPSGLILPADVAEKQLRRVRRPKGIDLFCGCGGFSLGMIQGGFEVVAAMDNDPTASITYMANLCSYPCNLVFVSDEDRGRFEKALAASYKSNGIEIGKNGDIDSIDGIKSRVLTAGSGYIADHPETPPVRTFIFGDCSKVSGEQLCQWAGVEIGELDCVFGGPPCQGFSKAGKQDINDERNDLVFEFIRLVLETRPWTMAMENVTEMVNMTTPDGRNIVDVIADMLQTGDYTKEKTIRKVLAAHFGKDLVLGRDRATPVRGKQPEKKERPETADLFATLEDVE